MMLADHGAEVIRVDRAPAAPALFGAPEKDVLNRSRTGIGVSLEDPEGSALVRRLCRSADGLITLDRVAGGDSRGSPLPPCLHHHTATKSRLV